MYIFASYVLAVLLMFDRPQTRGQAVSHASAIATPPARFALTRAANEALRLLRQQECARVFADFKDVSGRTLQERLDALGQTPGNYLSQITFREGRDRRCRNSSVLAYTTVGENDVFICSARFAEETRRNLLHVAAVIIHEMLHSLGLRENPPSSLEITAGVLRRCK